jgi:hypothetical protein
VIRKIGTRECGENERDHHIVDVTGGLFANETLGDNPHSEDLITWTGMR